MAAPVKPAVDKAALPDMAIENSAASITEGADANEGAGNFGAQLPPVAVAAEAAQTQVAPSVDDNAVNAGYGAQLPPAAGVIPADTLIPPTTQGVGPAPVKTDGAGRAILSDADGAPITRNQKFTDVSIYATGVDADVRAAVLDGVLVRKVANKDGHPVYRFFK